MSTDIQIGENFGMNPCTICDDKVAITHYTLGKDDNITLKTLILLKEYCPNVCNKCQFFICQPCSTGLGDECLCGGKIVTYKEFSGLFYEKPQSTETIR